MLGRRHATRTSWKKVQAIFRWEHNIVFIDNEQLDKKAQKSWWERISFEKSARTQMSWTEVTIVKPQMKIKPWKAACARTWRRAEARRQAPRKERPTMERCNKSSLYQRLSNYSHDDDARRRRQGCRRSHNGSHINRSKLVWSCTNAFEWRVFYCISES